MEPRTDCSASRLCGGSRSIKAHPDCGTAVTALMSTAGWRGRSYGRPKGPLSAQREAGCAQLLSTNSGRRLTGCGQVLWTSAGKDRLRASVEAADDPDELALDEHAGVEHRRVFLVGRLEADPAGFLEEALEGDRVLLDLGDHDVAVARRGLGPDHDEVAVSDV